MNTTLKSSTLNRLFNLKSRSISRELTVSLILIIIFFEGILLALVYQHQSHILLAQLEAQADRYAENLAQVLIVPIWDFDDEQIEKIGGGFAHNDVVDEITIIDAEGTVLFSHRNGQASGKRILRAVNIVYQNRPIGSVEFALSMDAYTAQLVWLRGRILLILAASLSVICITTGVLLRIFMRAPLIMLQKGIDRVARGNYSYKFDEIRHGELSGIADRFREMAAVVQAREQSLKEVNRELELEVDERRRAEDKIRASEAKSRALLDAIPDMIFQLDQSGLFIDYKGVQNDLIVAPESFLGKNITDIMPSELAALIMKRLANALQTRQIQIFEYELQLHRKPENFECRLVAISDTQAVAIVRNITEHICAAAERNRLEEQLRRAQKMEAIGTLAGGVAHDLNNVLSGLVSYPDMLLMDMPADSPLRQPILTIQKSGEKAAGIVQDLLTLARRGVSVSEIVNLNGIIRDYLKSPEYAKLQASTATFTVDHSLDENLASISGSSVHLSKTVMNLVANAAEALTENGRIVITTENRILRNPIAGFDNFKGGDYVELQISDNGVGIASSDIERIFEPFYTKKVMGRSGTGLGMAVVWGTVKDLGGHIDIQSTEGQGTTVTIYLPACCPETAEELRLPVSFDRYKGRGETILVVDDMADQLEIASHMLTKLGYRVTTASNGEAAIDHLAANAADLVILDMIMTPGIDGLETYKRIIQIRPGQKAIIASGFSESKRVMVAEGLGVGAYIKKPYLMEEIGMAIRKQLDR
ncbi:MAG: ATP-binding protein [Desulfobacterales bacterium]